MLRPRRVASLAFFVLSRGRKVVSLDEVDFVYHGVQVRELV